MREGEPFKKSLQESDYSPKIKLLENAPDKVVRVYQLYINHTDDIKRKLQRIFEKKFQKESDPRKLHDIEEEYRRKLKEAYQEKLYEEIDDFKRGMDIFYKLKNRYEISIPKMDFVVGDDAAYPKAYIVVDKISGKSIEEVENLPNEARDKMDTFYSSLIQYYIDVYKEGGDLWWNFSNDQIVYGRKKDDEEDKVYIVDVEPFYHKNGKFNKIHILLEFADMVSYIQNTEKKFSPPIQLTRARECLNNIVNALYNDPSSQAYRHKLLLSLKEKLI